MRKTFRKLRLVRAARSSLVLCALLAGGVTAAIVLPATSSAARANARGSLREALAHSVKTFGMHHTAALLTRRYAILRSAHPADVTSLPVYVQQVLNDLLEHRTGKLIGLNANGITSTTTGAGLTLYFVPGQAGDCMIAMQGTAGAGAGCGWLNSGELTLGLLTTLNGNYTMFGFVPNGNSAVTIKLANGANATVPVNNNAYGYTVPAGTQLRSVSGVDVGGSPTTDSFPQAPVSAGS